MKSLEFSRCKRPAVGSSPGRSGVQPRVAIAMDENTFMQVQLKAFKDGSSFARAARELIKLGLSA